MENSNYVHRRENKGLFGQKYNKNIDIEREEEILKVRKSIRNSDIQEGILEIGGLEKK